MNGIRARLDRLERLIVPPDRPGVVVVEEDDFGNWTAFDSGEPVDPADVPPGTRMTVIGEREGGSQGRILEAGSPGWRNCLRRRPWTRLGQS